MQYAGGGGSPTPASSGELGSVWLGPKASLGLKEGGRGLG